MIILLIIIIVRNIILIIITIIIISSSSTTSRINNSIQLSMCSLFIVDRQHHTMLTIRITNESRYRYYIHYMNQTYCLKTEAYPKYDHICNHLIWNNREYDDELLDFGLTPFLQMYRKFLRTIYIVRGFGCNQPAWHPLQPRVTGIAGSSSAGPSVAEPSLNNLYSCCWF